MATEVVIPQEYCNAIESIMNEQNVPLSKVRVKHIMDALGSTADSIEASFYLRKYRQQNKRIPKIQMLLNSIDEVIDALPSDSSEKLLLVNAVEAYNGNNEVEGDEF